jgi:hypothetical protein
MFLTVGLGREFSVVISGFMFAKMNTETSKVYKIGNTAL